MKRKVVITTSREPSPRTRSFVKDLCSLASWLVRLNRGKMTFYDIVEEAVSEGSSTLAVIGEMKGNPSIIRLYDLSDATLTGKVLNTYTIILKGVSLSRELGHHGVNLEDVKEILIEPPKEINEESKMAFFALHQLFNSGMKPPEDGKYISINVNTVYNMIKFRLNPGNQPVGPVIRYKKISSPGKQIELGEEAESSQV